MFSQASGPKVAILLCTYDGARYLAEQLDSHAAQTVAHWEVQVSDDGSRDATRAILEARRAAWGAGRLRIHQGPARGFAANFLSLVCRPELEADFFAYSDQDDIWHADKLERALRWLQSVPADVPALYCARTRLVDAAGHATGLSPWFSRPTGFANALLQNVASGNTMVFNGAARRLLQEAGQDVDVAAHDWWTYMVVTGCGGQVLCDAQPALDYRQHDTNVIGMNGGWGARVERIRMLWQGRFRRWNDGHVAALERLAHRLTPENREILGHFRTLREVGLLGRIIHFKRSGIYRQTFLGNIGLVAAVVFKKL